MESLNVPGYYVARNSKNKEQIVYYDGISMNKQTNETLYNGYYGVFGYHEVFTNIKNIRELTAEEIEYNKKCQFWKLPQHFYQSFPEH